MRPRRRDRRFDDARDAAGNGVLDRRAFLRGGAGAVATGAFMAYAPSDASAASPPETPSGMTTPGAPLSPYGSPATFEREVTRTLIRSQPGTTGAGASRTPLEALEGMITPSGLHFERHHNGVPTIDPAQHQLLIHGMVARPLIFTVASLQRYPMESRIHFLECSGNSALMYGATPPTLTCGQTHGLVSCSEWTGVPLRLLLEEAGVDPRADWVLAEGADAAAMSRSVPMAKAMDDAMLALYQNGERLRPENGYPVRLFLPGYEGNMSVKWLRRIKVTDTPTMTKDETSKYTDLRADGTSLMFTYPMEVKSVITRPAPGLKMTGPGLYELSGIAWSGRGKIRKVEVSADGGQTWAEAVLAAPVLAYALTRFRIAWKWNGAPTVLKSRATDDAGRVQPTRDELIAQQGANVVYHYHAIQAWRVESTGEVKNVYA
ncbi:MAG: sulfite dehydrogenase [Candidatus Rokuibacteriota bacterium]|nr:MAG: sulfite dehydrogenase [Candidatus Rokubacteria bacterium]